MPSPEIDARTRREWRDLGFFYFLDDEARRWRLVGTRPGLARFVALLRAYVADPRNVKLSEHEHYGPYSYLKVMTWTEPELDGHVIAGTLEDLTRLADLVESRLSAASPGQRLEVGNAYAPGSDYGLELEVAGDEFDPAAADPHCQG